jgi:small subunit ribosomal protein S29
MVDSTTPYTYDSKTQIYVQTHYAQQSLSRLLAVNKKALSTISLGREVELEKRKPISAGTSLAEVAEIGSKEHHHAPALLALVMATLGTQTKSVSL